MGGARAPVALLLALSVPVLATCRRREPPAPVGAPSSSNVPSVASDAEPPRPPVPTVTHGCRVLAVKGHTPPPAGTPAVGALLQGRSWVELAAGVELDVKHTETTRELRLIGPGRFLACAGGAEAIVVARGSVATTSGPGSRAGAEVELATPFGVVHYADAALRVDVTEGGVELAVTQGSAGVSATGTDALDAGAEPEPVRAPKGRLSLEGKVDAHADAARCVEARARVGGPATPSVPSARGERGAWAVGLLQARKAARLVCARARAAAGRSDGVERDRLEDQLALPQKPDMPTGSPPPPVAETDAGK